MMLRILLLLFPLLYSGLATATGTYRINAGDRLHVSVWGEESLQHDVLVLPDGTFTFPLVGTVHASGKNVEELTKLITKRLQPYVPEPTVTVTITDTSGNLIYVIGKVNNPGQYMINRPLDVLQALSLAGGLARFAKEDEIRILRRDKSGQRAIRFDYSAVISGNNLASNILLHSGDTIVVP